jgi:hypothetical protein
MKGWTPAPNLAWLWSQDATGNARQHGHLMRVALFPVAPAKFLIFGPSRYTSLEIYFLR